MPAGLLLRMSGSPLAGRHGSELGAALEREASWSNNDGCSSPGQMAGHGIMFTAMLTAERGLSLCVRCGPVCVLPAVYTWGPENGFTHLGKQMLPSCLRDCVKIIQVGRGWGERDVCLSFLSFRADIRG